VSTSPGEEAGIGAQRERPGRPAAAHPREQLLGEAPHATLARSLAKAGVQHLAGVGSGGEDGVVTEDAGVAEGRAVLVLAGDLDDRRVEVDRHRLAARPGAERPGPADRLGDHRVELADMTEGEGAEEGPERGWRHHLERQHLARRSGAQPVRVVDVARTGEDRRDEREHLAPGSRPTNPAGEAQRFVDQCLQTDADHERRRHDQPGVGDEARLVEDHPDPVGHAR